MNKIDCVKLYISTICPEARKMAIQFGTGLEVTEYCTADRMDTDFSQTDSSVRKQCMGIDRRVLHGPFNELFPCAIDPRARDLAASRYAQALELAESYGAEKLILHSGYAPMFYYDCWFREQSILFWKAFLQNHRSSVIICLENVLEESPEPLSELMSAVDDSRFRLCLDIGHVNAYASVPVCRWIQMLAPYIAHYHIHNNCGKEDRHGHLDEGTMKMENVIRQALDLCPEAGFTIEVTWPERDLNWLIRHGFYSELSAIV